MTAVLVFTRNFAMRQAIIALSPENRQIFFFNNRLAFLVCATVFDKPYIIIDTVHETGENIRWLHSRLAARGLSRQTHFIVPENIAANSFLKAFGLITTIKELKKICSRAAKFTLVESSCSLVNVLHQRFKDTLSEDYFDFLVNIYDPTNKIYLRKNRSDTNRLQYVKSRLFLGSSLELKQLILMLSSEGVSRRAFM
ncbi:hypothetical protein [Enterobacter quasihormaechei]|uniref:hypothetical protein n=1 Tax=Enterobacter quasihormaechei TaxID=2529382 RepID=UPI003D6DEDB4